jgi:nucleotide-binding universal stress UspA family protein
MKRAILVPVDLSHNASFDLIFPAITALATAHNAALHLLTVVPYIPRRYVDDSRKQAEEQLAEIAGMDLPDDIEWHSEALIGPIAPTIVRRATDLGAGLIVIASHDPKALDILLGGVADRVLRRAPCSVLVLRAAGGWQWND